MKNEIKGAARGMVHGAIASAIGGALVYIGIRLWEAFGER